MPNLTPGPALSPEPASALAGRQVAARAQLVLFDLDGTLADTAPDLIDAINGCLVRRGMAARPIGELRPWASRGARGLIGRAFGLGPQDPGYEELRVEFIESYEAQLCRHTSLFPGVTETLARIEAAGLRWGIVTNKVSRLTTPLVHALGLDAHAACVVSGDTAARPKPDPAPIHHALELCRCGAADGIYVGDDRRDIEAGRSAGVRTFAVAYGYSSAMDDIRQWRADHIIHRPSELLDWLLPGQA